MWVPVLVLQLVFKFRADDRWRLACAALISHVAKVIGALASSLCLVLDLWFSSAEVQWSESADADRGIAAALC